MYRLTIFTLLVLSSTVGLAQLQPTPRVVQRVSDPSMVLDDRGTKLEVLPTSRATQQMASSGRQVVHSIFATSESAPINRQERGVVFNHSMQVQGYITGEIAFQMKNGVQAAGKLDPASYPGLAKLTVRTFI